MIVIDASALAFAIGDDTEVGRRAYDVVDALQPVAAPDVVNAETLASLRKAWLTGSMSDDRLAQAVTHLNEFPLARYETTDLLERAAELRANVTAYDAMYVALAEMLECPLFTADRRLAHATGPECEFIVLPLAPQ